MVWIFDCLNAKIILVAWWVWVRLHVWWILY